MDPIKLSIKAVPYVKDIVLFCYQVIEEIHKRFQMVKGNKLFQKHIKEKVEELQKAIEDLESSGLAEFPKFCEERLRKIRESLLDCLQTCEELHHKGVLQKMTSVYDHESKLLDMEKQLESANSNLHYIISALNLKQTKKLQKAVDVGFARTATTVIEGNRQLMGTLVHPEGGVYRGECADSKPPSVISALHLSEVRGPGEKLMIIEWHDTNNLVENIEKYEVQYDDDMIIPGTPNDFSISGSDSKFMMKLGRPKVVEKRSYTIRVRAVKKGSPGPWSEPNTIHFLCDPPSKPKKPEVNVRSRVPTEVAVTIQALKENEMNGSQVHSCAVEYMQVTKPKKQIWERCIFDVKHSDIGKKMSKIVKSLKPDTRYNFRIVMVNEIGESQPSEECEILTHQLLPGIPQALRISSKRGDKVIKIRWEPPHRNPHVVRCYRAQIRRAKSKSDSWTAIPTTTGAVNKLSAKATNLKTDTKYLFRVRAVNDRGEYGEFTNAVEGETKVGKAARIAAAAGAFVGGTVGGPLLGAATIGFVAAEDKSKPAAVAAGIGGGVGGAILGTIGAPLFGGAAAMLTYDDLKGTCGNSPQTSDDEEEK